MGEADFFHRLGGLERTTRMALDLYDRVMESKRLEPFFAGVDMRRLVDHQARFLASLLGGPESVTDEQLKRAHARLAIDQASFREMVGHFRQVLEQHDLPGDTVEGVLAEITKREHLIVTVAGTRGSRAV